MADSSPLGGPLDCARNAFALALGFAQWLNELDRPAVNYDPTGETKKGALRDLRRQFSELVEAVLRCAPVVSSQGGNGEVATAVRALAEWTAKWDAKTDNDQSGQAWIWLSGEWPALKTFGWNGLKAIEAAENPSIRRKWDFLDGGKTSLTLLDTFPATPAGHLGFLEFVRDEIHHAAEAKRGQLERGYSNATIESMVRGIKWSEASARLAEIPDLTEGMRATAGDILHRELTVGTVEQIDALLQPAIWGVRESLEQARLADLSSKMVVVATAGDLWKVYSEGKRPCFQSSGISFGPGRNTPTISCTDGAAETKRTGLDLAQALVTAEGGDKAAAMEKLIARVQLQAGMDKASVINMPLAEFVAAAMGRSAASESPWRGLKTGDAQFGNRQQPIPENVSDRLPETDDEIELLKPAIAWLLRTIPEAWATFDHDALTAIQANALFLLTAAGMVERRDGIRARIASHPTYFELRFQATGEGGFAKAMENATAIQFETWADAWRTWCAGETGNRSPFHAEGLSPQEWRLTGQGILARGELADDHSPATVFDFVLKRGFFGPGFWFRKQLNGQTLTDDERRILARHLAAGDDLARLPRPAVVGEGRLIELRKLDQPTGAKVVSLANWSEGAHTFADAFRDMLGPKFEGLAAKPDTVGGEPSKPAGDTSTPTKAKRSTERGEGRAKLIAALTKHHKYADGGCLNLESVGNNELARLAGVSESTASAFFNKQFEGHTQYRAICADVTTLVAALKLLNQEYAPHHLFGAKPPDESEREGEE